MRTPTFNPRDWYWNVNGYGPHVPEGAAEVPLADKVYSSARGIYVSNTDPAYLVWKEETGKSHGGYDPTTLIATEGELTAVLREYDIRFLP